MSNDSSGQIITFYSYKGGTGRTMALANVACLLAKRQEANKGKGVLMIDWDLEAPGLHRYFQNRLRLRLSHSFINDPIDERPGLIDIFYELDKATDEHLNKSKLTNASQPPVDNEKLARDVLQTVKPETYALETTVDSLFLIKAGSFNKKQPEEYSARVNTFKWEALYHKAPFLIRSLAERMAENFEYVLIDSRTGVTDVSGICTMLMPEKLVLVFTPNLQSLSGGIEQVKRAAEYRRQSSDLRPLAVYPLVSRVEANEPSLREQWRFGSSDKGIVGYQPEFERTFEEIYRLPQIRLENYFNEMQIQQVPRYAYGEEIAALVEEIEDRFSLKRSYESFAQWLVRSNVSWADEKAPIYDKPLPIPISIYRSTRAVVKRYIQNHPFKVLLAVLFLTSILVVYAFYQINELRYERELTQSELQSSRQEAELAQAKSMEATRRAEEATFRSKMAMERQLEAEFQAKRAEEQVVKARTVLRQVAYSGVDKLRGTIVDQALEIYRLKQRIQELDSQQQLDGQ